VKAGWGGGGGLKGIANGTKHGDKSEPIAITTSLQQVQYSAKNAWLFYCIGCFIVLVVLLYC